MKRMRSDDIVSAGRLEYIESEICWRGGKGLFKIITTKNETFWRLCLTSDMEKDFALFL